MGPGSAGLHPPLVRVSKVRGSPKGPSPRRGRLVEAGGLSPGQVPGSAVSEGPCCVHFGPQPWPPASQVRTSELGGLVNREQHLLPRGVFHSAGALGRGRGAGTQTRWLGRSMGRCWSGGRGWVSAWDPLAEAPAWPQCPPWGSPSGWAGAHLLLGTVTGSQGRGTKPWSLCGGGPASAGLRRQRTLSPAWQDLTHRSCVL